MLIRKIRWYLALAIADKRDVKAYEAMQNFLERGVNQMGPVLIHAVVNNRLKVTEKEKDLYEVRITRSTQEGTELLQ